MNFDVDFDRTGYNEQPDNISLQEFFSLGSLTEFYEKYFRMDDRSPELEREFENYIERTFLRISAKLLMFASILIVLAWPLEYMIFTSREILFWFDMWHGGVFALFLLLSMEISFVNVSRNFPIGTIVLGIMLALFWVGYCLANATRVSPPGSPWFYAVYFFPFFTVVIPLRMKTRLLATASIVTAFLGGFFLGFPQFLNPTYFWSVIVLIGSIILGSAFIGHVFYHLTRRNFFNEKKLEYIASHDQLTGLLEPDELDQNLNKTLAEAERYDYPVSLMMIDLDHFKKINDTHGHETGNVVLEEFGTVIQKEVRDPDIPARYGGEEFTIVMPHTSKSAALNLAERIQSELRNRSFEGDEENFTVTCSIGIAESTDSDTEKTDLVKRADQALYTAKDQGRDQIVVK